MVDNDILVFIPDDKAQRYIERNIKEERYYDEIQQQFEPFPEKLLNQLDLEGLKMKLREIKKEDLGKKSDADKLLAYEILDFIKVNNGIASEGGFWNGLSLLVDEIYNYIIWRWDYKNLKIFRKTINDANYKRAKIIRFITSSTYSRIRKHTLARIWWSAKIVPKEYLDVFWYQQDTVDRFLEKPFGAFNERGEISNLVKKFLEVYEKLHNEGKFVKDREDKMRDILIWLRVLEEKVYSIFNNDWRNVCIKIEFIS
ncbi:MAG: DUF6339 family protein [Candidatus Lokiarchaeota archaeon]